MLRSRSALFIAAVAPVMGWWDNGHMLTAEIAVLSLPAESIQRFETLLSEWEAFFPGTSDLPSASIWPDLIKCAQQASFCNTSRPAALEAFSSWHFDDQPWNPDRLPLAPYLSTIWNQQPSATWAINSALGTFKQSKSRFALNLMLRFVLHLVGDIHQPLHTISGYFNDSTYGHLPDGDHGGNLIKVNVTGQPSLTNLHATWDAVGGLYTHNWPYSPSLKAQLRANATRLIAKFPRNSSAFDGRYSSEELTACWNSQWVDCSDALTRWANESFALAVNAYSGVSNGGTLSVAYLSALEHNASIQLALGGYRLADLLTLIDGTEAFESDKLRTGAGSRAEAEADRLERAARLERSEEVAATGRARGARDTSGGVCDGPELELIAAKARIAELESQIKHMRAYA
jgi:hypothetical protein